MKKRYSNSTFMSAVVELVGLCEVVISIFIIIGGLRIMYTPFENEIAESLMMFFGLSAGIIVIVSGSIIFLNGALFVALAQSVGFSKQNNEMLKDIISR